MRRSLLVAAFSLVIIAGVGLGAGLGDDTALRIDHVLPDIAGEGDQITLIGQGFRFDSMLLWDNLPLKSQYIDRTEIRFEIPLGVNCGAHTLQIENPLTRVGSLLIERERSQLREIFVNCGPAARRPALVIDLDRVEPSRADHSTPLTLYGGGFVSPGTKVQFDNQILDATVLSESQLRFEIPDDVSCGMHSIRVQSQGTGGALYKPNKVLWVEVLCGEFVRSPSIAADFEMADFDENGNCRIENNEIFRALDAWIEQRLFSDLFFEVVDAWVTGRDICAPFMPFGAEDSLSAISLNLTGRGLVFRANGPISAPFHVAIYDLQGHEVYNGTSSDRLLWRLRDSENHPVPNGIYVANLVQNRLGGKPLLITTKLVVMR